MKKLVSHKSKRNNKVEEVERESYTTRKQKKRKEEVTLQQSKREEVEKKEVTLQQVKVNAKTNKWKEGREVVLVLSCHPSNTTLYTLSLFHFNG